MYTKTIFLSILTTTFIIISCGSGVERQAYELLELEMYDEASTILMEEIKKNPKNSDLHILLGRCYLGTDNLRKANESFDRCITLNSDKKNEVAKVFLNEGIALLTKENISKAKRYFTIAEDYDSSITKTIGQKLFGEGEKAFRVDKSFPSRMLFSLSADYAPEYKSEIAKIFNDSAIQLMGSGNIDQALSFCKSALLFDRQSCNNIPPKALEIAQSKAVSYQNTDDIVGLGKLSIEIDKSNIVEWGNLLFKVISEEPDPYNPNDLIRFCHQIVEWNADLHRKVSEILFVQAERSLRSQPLDTKNASKFFRQAVIADENKKARAGTIVWRNLSQNIPYLKTINKQDFITLFNLCKEIGVPEAVKESSKYYFASGLYFLDKGNAGRRQAIRIFKRLMTIYPNSPEAQKVKLILSPPALGTREFNSSPFEFRAKWRKRMNIRLLRAIVTENDIELVFKMKALDNNTYLLYPTRSVPRSKWSNIPKIEELYIIDDNGNKFSAKSGCSGGRQSIYGNEIFKKVDFNSGEEATLSAKFLMISEGATTIEFVSPEYSGNQGKWRWSDIRLKEDPFSYLMVAEK